MHTYPESGRRQNKGETERRSPAAFIAAGLLVILAALSLGGCTIPTSDKSFPSPSPSPEAVIIDARSMVQTAVKVMDNDAKARKFWYTGYVKSNVETRSITSMYGGVMNREDDAYTMNGRVATQAFSFYSKGSTKYINDHNVWLRANPDDALPNEPFLGFEDWLPLVEKASKLKNESILGDLCEVVQIKISAKEWVEKSGSGLFAELRAKMDSDEAVNLLLQSSIVKMTLWIGKENHFIYQYSTWIVMPLPGAGYFDQETYFRFFRYDDPDIERQLVKPESIEYWVNQIEEMLKAGEVE